MDERYYEIEGKKYERVSTILSTYTEPWVMEWKLKVGKRESGVTSRRALKIGTQVHNYVESDIKEGGYRLRKTELAQIWNCMRAWEKFKEAYKPHIIETEKRVYCSHMRVAGRYDGRSETTLYDWKTSGSITQKNWVQLAIYNHMSGLRLPNLAICRLDKNIGEYEYEEREMDYGLVEVFKALHTVHRFFEPDENIEGGAELTPLGVIKG